MSEWVLRALHVFSNLNDQDEGEPSDGIPDDCCCSECDMSDLRLGEDSGQPCPTCGGPMCIGEFESAGICADCYWAMCKSANEEVAE